MICEICEKAEAEFRHMGKGESYCKDCLKKEFHNLSFEDYLEELFIPEGSLSKSSEKRRGK